MVVPPPHTEPEPRNCSKNQVWNNCPTSSDDLPCSQAQNDSRGATSSASDCGVPRCICPKDYFRNECNACVLAANCDDGKSVTCPAGQKAVCGSDCTKLTCADKNITVKCDEAFFVTICNCDNGQVFAAANKTGECISKSECPKT